jgi:transposase-like protein
MAENPRLIRALDILARGNQITRLSANYYRVRSQSNPEQFYKVQHVNGRWVCGCPDYTFRFADKVTNFEGHSFESFTSCKHCLTVTYSLRLRAQVADETIHTTIPSVPYDVCRFCDSKKLVKRGVRGQVQRYRCVNCGKWVTLNFGFERRHYSPEAITAALDLYFKGVSFRNIADHMKQFFGKKPSPSTIHEWLVSYSQIASKYVEQFKPQVGGFMHVDETKVNVDGKLDWLWNLMDADTRFWVSSLITKGRSTEDARAVFQDAKSKLPFRPKAIIHDGLGSYNDAFKKEFYHNRGRQTFEMRSVSIREKGKNNRVERLRNTLKDRTKTQRALDNDESAQVMIDALRIAYNFTRPHMALGGRTPAEAAGLDLQLNGNRWKELIRQSAINPSK